MFQAVPKKDGDRSDPLSLSPPTSRLFSELLDANHDAWRVFRNGQLWTFYREIGRPAGGLPTGAVVLTSEVAKPQTCDLYTSKGRRSLVASYSEEIPKAVQALIDRERVISLFSRLAYCLDPSSWDHNLSFSGVDVIERRVALRSDVPAYERLVGDAKGRMVSGGRGSVRSLPHSGGPGLRVSEFDTSSPLVEYDLTYPRHISGRFLSSRLRQGLHSITHQMVALVVDHNRALERSGNDSDCDHWD